MDIIKETTLTDEAVQKGAEAFQRFWLLPKSNNGQTAAIRMEIQGYWSGWKLKDGLVDSLGLTIGDTINAHVKVLGNYDLIDDDAKGDLFASGDAALWLIENKVGNGAIIDARVRFKFHKAPVGGVRGDEIMKASIILEEGLRVVKPMEKHDESQGQLDAAISSISKLLNGSL